jgi:hypothetical protein
MGLCVCAAVNEGMMSRAQLRRLDPALAACLAAAFGEPVAPAVPWNFTHELASPTRERWMRRQTSYLLLRHLLMANADALANLLERLYPR